MHGQDDRMTFGLRTASSPLRTVLVIQVLGEFAESTSAKHGVWDLPGTVYLEQ